MAKNVDMSSKGDRGKVMERAAVKRGHPVARALLLQHHFSQHVMGQAKVTGLGGDIAFGLAFGLDDPTRGVPRHLVRQGVDTSRFFSGPKQQIEYCSVCWTLIHSIDVLMASFPTVSHQPHPAALG